MLVWWLAAISITDFTPCLLFLSQWWYHPGCHWCYLVFTVSFSVMTTSWRWVWPLHWKMLVKQHSSGGAGCTWTFEERTIVKLLVLVCQITAGNPQLSVYSVGLFHLKHCVFCFSAYLLISSLRITIMCGFRVKLEKWEIHIIRWVLTLSCPLSHRLARLLVVFKWCLRINIWKAMSFIGHASVIINDYNVMG